MQCLDWSDVRTTLEDGMRQKNTREIVGSDRKLSAQRTPWSPMREWVSIRSPRGHERDCWMTSSRHSQTDLGTWLRCADREGRSSVDRVSAFLTSHVIGQKCLRLARRSLAPNPCFLLRQRSNAQRSEFRRATRPQLVCNRGNKCSHAGEITFQKGWLRVGLRERGDGSLDIAMPHPQLRAVGR